MKGAVDWYAHGLNEPERVTQATEEYREESDPYTDWVEANFEKADGAWVSNEEIKKRGNNLPIGKGCPGLIRPGRRQWRASSVGTPVSPGPSTARRCAA